MYILLPIIPRSKKNSQKIIYNSKTKKPMIIQNEKYLEFENNCQYFIKKDFRKMIDSPINLKCEFYVPDARRRDLANYIEAIQDILVKYNVIKDDNYNIIQSVDGSRMYIDRKNPRVEIWIKKEEEKFKDEN